MRVALYQMNSGINAETNARDIVDAIAEAGRGDSAMLFTPEMCGLLDRDRRRAAQTVTTEIENTVLDAVRQAAAEHNIWVHIGSLALRAAPASDRFVNRGFVIDNTGAIRARYDKIHLFDVDLDTGESWRESAVYDGGDEAICVKTPLGQLGLSVCYDLRFAELYKVLSNAGATILTVPAAFTVPTGKAHWHTLLKARAIESASFVIAAAQYGEHEDGRATYGHSLVIDPWGEILLDMEETVGVGFVDLNLDHVAAVRRRIPVINHRKAISPTVVTL